MCAAFSKDDQGKLLVNLLLPIVSWIKAQEICLERKTRSCTQQRRVTKIVTKSKAWCYREVTWKRGGVDEHNKSTRDIREGWNPEQILFQMSKFPPFLPEIGSFLVLEPLSEHLHLLPTISALIKHCKKAILMGSYVSSSQDPSTHLFQSWKWKREEQWRQ